MLEHTVFDVAVSTDFTYTLISKKRTSLDHFRRFFFMLEVAAEVQSKQFQQISTIPAKLSGLTVQSS